MGNGDAAVGDGADAMDGNGVGGRSGPPTVGGGSLPADAELTGRAYSMNSRIQEHLQMPDDQNPEDPVAESFTALADRIRQEAPEVRRLVANDAEFIGPLAEYIQHENQNLDPDYVRRLDAGETKPGAREEWLAWAKKYLRLLEVIRGIYVPA